MAYDSQSDRIILFGGAAVGAPGLLLLNDETWVYGPPLTLPGAPLNPQKVPGDRRIVLSWQSPSSNGGVPIINYRIFRGTASGSLSFLTELGNVLGYTDTGLTNGVTYYY